MIKNHTSRRSKGINFLTMTQTLKIKHQDDINPQNKQFTKLLQRRNHSPLNNHKSQKCSRAILSETLNLRKNHVKQSKRKQFNDGYIKQIMFKEMSQPQGDSNMSILSVKQDYIENEENQIYKNQPKVSQYNFFTFNQKQPTLKNQIIQQYSSTRQKDSYNSNQHVQLLREENKLLKQRNKHLQSDIMGRKQHFKYLSIQINDLKETLKKLQNMNKLNESVVPNSLATNTMSRLQIQQSRQMIAQDIYKRLKLIQLLNYQ